MKACQEHCLLTKGHIHDMTLFRATVSGVGFTNQTLLDPLGVFFLITDGKHPLGHKLIPAKLRVCFKIKTWNTAATATRTFTVRGQRFRCGRMHIGTNDGPLKDDNKKKKSKGGMISMIALAVVRK